MPANVTRLSYWFVPLLLILAEWLNLGGAFVGGLFAYFAVTKLHFFKRRTKWIAVVCFLVLFGGIAYGLGYLINQAVRVLPGVAEQAIPLLIQWAKEHQIELPFTDFDSLKDLALDSVKNQAHYLGSVARFARGATSGFLLVLVSFIVAVGVFLQPRFELEAESPPLATAYSQFCQALAARARTFYSSFATVMGAQIIISAINTVLTSVFVLISHLPNGFVVIGATFLCGLIPVVGNVVSNTIVVGIAITVSPQKAIAALVFLVVVHKLEYFLNSKIVGDRIRNPFWLTLVALVLGEKLMGIPGMILAPVVLHYLKLECSNAPKNGQPSPTGA
jgi:predicted PurR-regulated permease PerM